MGATPRVILLPGLGADERLYEAQVRAMPTIEVVPWSVLPSRRSVFEIAETVAAHIDVDARPLIVGGSSFGGFVAWELAQLVGAAAVVLLGSASSPSAVRGYLRPLLPVAPWLPSSFHRALQVSAPAVAPVFGARGVDAPLFTQMMRDSDPRRMGDALKAIASWRPTSSTTTTRVFRLHGRRDRIIAPPTPGDDVVILDDAGHLPTMTHAADVNRFLCSIGDAFDAVRR